MLWLLTRTVSDSSFEHPEQMFKLTDRKILVISAIKETKSATMNSFRFFFIFFLNHL